jgi:GNAT superfamily N-acetyltransferase
MIINGEFRVDERTKADPNNIWEMNLKTDLGQVKKIWQHGAKKEHRKFIPEAFWDSIDIEKEIRYSKEKYVYKKDGITRGFITAREDGYIFELYVDFQEEDFRGKGIGTSLFKTLKGENPKFPQLKGRYSKFTSSVYAHNYKSFAWHIKRDFKVRGISFCPHTGLPKFQMIWQENNCAN